MHATHCAPHPTHHPHSPQLIILCNEGDDAMAQFEARGCSLIRVPRTVRARPFVPFPSLPSKSLGWPAARAWQLSPTFAFARATRGLAAPAALHQTPHFWCGRPALSKLTPS
jgi:hypothetical protein